MTARSTRALIITLLAGRAAEIVFFGQASSGSGNGNDSDLAQVTALAKAYHSEWGLSDAVPRYEPFMPASPIAAGYLRQKIENTLAKSEQDAKNLVEKYKDEIEAFALKLMTAGELSGDALISALPDISSEQVHDPIFMTG
jgi:cell division protease FtsH